MRKIIKIETEEEIVICDVCGARTSRNYSTFPKCEICGKEMCLKHKIYDLSVFQKGTILSTDLEYGRIVVCENCLDKVNIKDLRFKKN